MIQVQVNGIFIIIIPVNCLNLANLIVFIKLMLMGVICRNVRWIKCISENTFNIFVILVLNSLFSLRIQLVLSQCSEGGTIEGTALVVQYLGGHHTSHIPRRAKIPYIRFLIFSHSRILIKPLNPLIERDLIKT
jgi:hypothetical protein